MVPLPRNKKQTYWLNSRAQIWPSDLTLAMTLTFNFHGQIWNLLYLIKKMVRLPRNKQQTYRLNSRPQMWTPGFTLAMALTFNFHGQIWNLLYLSQKWSDCHEMKTKHINWTPGLKCDQWVWPLTMTLTFECWRSNVTLTFDHTHDPDHGFWWSNFEIVVSQNGSADWHCTKGVAVGHSWPWLWPFAD